MSEQNMVETALAAGKRLGGADALLQSHGGVPYLLVPEGVTPQSFEWALTNPVRKRAVVALRDAASFTAYVNAFKDAGSMVFASLPERTLTAVLDYHEAGAGSARWGQHRAVMACQLTEDWKRWIAQNKKALGQVEFAQFLEDNLPNIAAPAGAVILDIAKTLQAKKAVNFSSSVRLENGETQFVYEETIAGSAGQKGHLEVPSSFTLGIEPFEGAGLYAMEARFRYRIAEGGRLQMWFDLVRPEAVIEDAFKRTREAITSGVAPTTVLAAQAPLIG